MGKYRGREQLHKFSYEGDDMTSEGEEIMHLDEPDSPKTNTERQRMRPWLMQILNDGNTDGIQWIDKEDGKFRVAWKHGARSGYNAAKDASVFELWAEHTDRKTRESSQSDTKRWKANFRCALASLSDVQLVKEEGKSKGNDAFRVYRFMTPADNKTKMPNSKTSKRKHPVQEYENDKKKCLRKRSRSTRSYKEETDDNSLNSTGVEEMKSIAIETVEVIDCAEEKKTFKPELRQTDSESGITHGTLPMHGCGYSVKVMKTSEDIEYLPEAYSVSESSIDESSLQSMSPGYCSADTTSCTSRSSTPGEAPPTTPSETVLPLIDLLLQRNREPPTKH